MGIGLNAIIQHRIAMSLTSTIIDFGLLMTLIAVILVIYVTIKYRKGKINEDPSELQFARLKNIPGEDYVDLNVVKVGKTKTLGAYSSSGFISWEAYFNPKTPEDMKKRTPATIAVIVIFAMGIVMTAIMKLMVIPIGYYFGLAYLFLASALVLVKFIQFKILKR